MRLLHKGIFATVLGILLIEKKKSCLGYFRPSLHACVISSVTWAICLHV